MAETLEGYARRGVFRGYGRDPAIRDGKCSFKLLWHYDREFELVFDARRNTLRFPLVLPNVPSDASMYRDLKRFIEERHSSELPEHRRIDRRKAVATPTNRRGNVSLTMRLRGGDDEYGARKLIHLVQEIFLVFLQDGSYYEYMVESFDLDPDRF
ncbi:MAG TPA: hypothetical protein VJH03_00305 [Blastocatellia bacterium]|nr:hypothetical protein [Blastocatellia bacterium]